MPNRTCTRRSRRARRQRPARAERTVRRSFSSRKSICRALRLTPGRISRGARCMKAVVVEHRGEAGIAQGDSNADIPSPSEILVRVTAAGVNPIDWKMRDRDDRPLPSCSDKILPASSARRATASRSIARANGFSESPATTAPTPNIRSLREDDRVRPVCKIPDDVGDADAAAPTDCRSDGAGGRSMRST